MKRRKIKKETTFGDEVLHGLTDFFQSVERGEPITLRTIRLNLQPSEYGPRDVKRTREMLRVSQAIFAQLMAVSTKTIQSWEQADRPVPGPARRLMDEMNSNPHYWMGLIRNAVKEQLAHA